MFTIPNEYLNLLQAADLMTDIILEASNLSDVSSPAITPTWTFRDRERNNLALVCLFFHSDCDNMIWDFAFCSLLNQFKHTTVALLQLLELEVHH